MDLSVVVPVCNDEDSGAPLQEAVTGALRSLDMAYELVIVDDGSSDKTAERLAEIAARDHRVVVLRFRRNAGQTAAMFAGIEHARGRIIATMDGDLQNDPADIPMMLDKIGEGYDLVVGWRINRQDKLLSRKLPSRIANWLIGRVTGLPIRDNGCSLKVYRASVIQKVPLYSDMHRFIPAMTIPLGARIAEVGVRHHARQFGQSKYGLSRIYKVMIDLIAIKTLLMFAERPISRFAGLGSVFAVLSLAVFAIWFNGSAFAPGTAIVPVTVAMLLGSLSLFLVLAGVVAAVVHRRPEMIMGRDGTGLAPDA